MQSLDNMILWKILVPKMLVQRRGRPRKENRKHTDAAMLAGPGWGFFARILVNGVENQSDGL